MEEAGYAYEQILSLCRERFPDLAQQVQDEISLGRRVQGSQLLQEDREHREARMQESGVGRRIGKDEQAVVPYDDDQRLQLLLNAISRWLVVAQTSRAQLRQMADEQGLPPTIRFSMPDGTQQEAQVVGLTGWDDDSAAAEAVRVVTEAEASVNDV